MSNVTEFPSQPKADRTTLVTTIANDWYNADRETIVDHHEKLITHYLMALDAHNAGQIFTETITADNAATYALRLQDALLKLGYKNIELEFKNASVVKITVPL